MYLRCNHIIGLGGTGDGGDLGKGKGAGVDRGEGTGGNIIGTRAYFP
jgi:hypothetical protein